MITKQELQTGDSSNAVQVGRDNITTINNTTVQGLSYSDVVAIFEDLFHRNLPAMQQIANNIATQRIEEYLYPNLQKSFEAHQDEIDSSKFTEPLVQYLMSEITLGVALRGKKANAELLTELLCIVVSKNTTDTIELMCMEAIKIIPNLNKNHLAYLTIVTFATEYSVKTEENEMPNVLIVENVDTLLANLFSEIPEADSINNTDIWYLQQRQVIVAKGILTVGGAPPYLKSISEFKDKKLDEIKSYSTTNKLPNILKFLELCEKYYMGRFNLMPIGSYIGRLQVSQHFNLHIDNDSLFPS